MAKSDTTNTGSPSIEELRTLAGELETLLPTVQRKLQEVESRLAVSIDFGCAPTILIILGFSSLVTLLALLSQQKLTPEGALLLLLFTAIFWIMPTVVIVHHFRSSRRDSREATDLRAKYRDLFEELQRLLPILAKHDQLELAKKFEIAGRYEDAAKIYDQYQMYEEAGRVRKLDRIQVQKVVSVSVDLNAMLQQLKLAGLVVAHSCSNCGASLKISGSSTLDGVVSCQYCKTTFDTASVAQLITKALEP